MHNYCVVTEKDILMNKLTTIFIGGVIGFGVLGAGAWIAIWIISGAMPEISSVVGPIIVGPLVGAWWGSKYWSERHPKVEQESSK